MIVISGLFRLDEGVTEEVLDACRVVMKATRPEEGCIDYVFSADPLDGQILRVFEMWEDQASLDNHFETPHVDVFRKAMGAWTISEREIKKFETDTVGSM
ncbi:MAG: putative quinol monooxygenase [Acidimicrobiales bacterium]|jgi:quinol monooxygenase YgiN|nr:putative quinol monooxygenase [Acidimicrobiales bacterium]MDP6298564.1 putative quinol monooxygenase [Acidimicrobiales bacterium]HJM29127.1 putative quinol monooxygenase [Acidimicrobiales bacterium]HJM97443.1 putative quinol monooxygenase [Acidimicrobiales bacterium]